MHNLTRKLKRFFTFRNPTIPADPQKIHDSRSPEFLEMVRTEANTILTHYGWDIFALNETEKELLDGNKNPEALGEHMAIKLARSKALLTKIKHPVKIGIVVPVYHETVRMQPRVGSSPLHGWITPLDFFDHPNGENFVYEKAKQVSWLSQGMDNVSFQTIYVDDACTLGSGDKIKELLDLNPQIENAEVYKLTEIISQGNLNPNSLLAKSVAGLASAQDSQKSGAVYAGMAIALEKHECDIVIYTDADLSYDLGQIGILIHPLIEEGFCAAVANRNNEHSYTEDVFTGVHQPKKRRIKAILGSLRAELFEGVLPPDTQAGFKAIKANEAHALIEAQDKDNTFAFDVQLLARLFFQTNQLPASVGTVCIDSPEETTADGTTTYQAMARTYLHVAKEFGLGMSGNALRSYVVLELLASERCYGQQTLWNAIYDLMDDNVIPPHEIAPSVERLRSYFLAGANNTANSLPLDESHYEELIHVLEYVKKRPLAD